MSTFAIGIIIFLGVTGLILCIGFLLTDSSESKTEDRLTRILHDQEAARARGAKSTESVLAQPLEQNNFFEGLLTRSRKFGLLFEQADTTLTASMFFLISGGLAVVAMAISVFAGVFTGMIPLVGIVAGLIPLMWLMSKRNARLKQFARQLPDALELMSRALRAGHSLTASFRLVADEMTAPIASEFGRVFDEQNLGIPVEEALDGLSERVPNLDLRFFCTALKLQRQTGGDLAEILDKIGYLVRERFKIWGQVQALTGEGRLSGVVLLGLPPVLFVVVYRLNPEYLKVLFTDPLGKQMLAGAVVLQLIGAVVIRKIVNIRV